MKYFLVLVAHVLFVLALQIWMDRKAPRGAISSRFRFTCIAVAVCVAGYVWFVSEPTLMLFGDFLEVYYQAGAIVLRDAQGLSAFMDGVHAYTNIPVSAYVFLPFRPAGSRSRCLGVLGNRSALGHLVMVARLAA